MFPAEEVDGRNLNASKNARSPLASGFQDGRPGRIAMTPPELVTPPKRRPGRPPRRPQAMLSGLGSPPTPRIMPLPAHNPREKLNLPKPSFRRIDAFAGYEADRAAHMNYVDRTMAHFGYQESDKFRRPPRKVIRLSADPCDADQEQNLNTSADKDASSGLRSMPIGRVEYDMDEQDWHWLDVQNASRERELLGVIKPAIFEITMTYIEKEWHALEKRK